MLYNRRRKTRIAAEVIVEKGHAVAGSSTPSGSDEKAFEERLERA